MKETPIRIVVIAGPTAVGKTAFAIAAAKRFQGEIVSCDSMQLYRYMDIGSAKPTPEEREAVPHHLVDEIDPREEFSVARYASLARDAIRDIASRGKLPVISGGTGLYLNALLYEMDFGDAPKDPAYRRYLENIAGEHGSIRLHEMLQAADPQAAARIHPNNRKKLIRALERLQAGESQVSAFSQVTRENPALDPLLIGLARDREVLYDRINRRVDQLLEAGLAEEVAGLLAMGLDEDHISMKGIGYKEMIAYLAGRCSLEQAREQIQKNTRHYAKRQYTWFRRYDKMFWLNISSYRDDQAAQEVMIQWLEKNLSNSITEATSRTTSWPGSTR